MQFQVEVQAQMGWGHNTSKLKVASTTVTSSILNISAQEFVFVYLFIYLFIHVIKKHIPLPMKTDESIQRKYNFSMTVNFEKEHVFGSNKCAKKLEAKYITWL